LDISST